MPRKLPNLSEVGATKDSRRRLATSGGPISFHTSKGDPWQTRAGPTPDRPGTSADRTVSDRGGDMTRDGAAAPPPTLGAEAPGGGQPGPDPSRGDERAPPQGDAEGGLASRGPGPDAENAFDEGTIRLVWKKGDIAYNADPDIWRKDQCNAWMRWDAYEDRDSQFGWEIDYITPISEGGRHDLSNLRPLQWRNRMSKRGRRLTCPLTASGRYNAPR